MTSTSATSDSPAFGQPLQLAYSLPDWLLPFAQQNQPVASRGSPSSATDRERMAFVLAAARENIRRQTGGPFAAAVWNNSTGELVSLGVNLVPAQHSSWLHAEMVAIALAQDKVGHEDLSTASYELVTSTEPCAMCLGAIPWSGIGRLVTGASDEMARSIGFNEGCKPQPWQQGLTQRGIDVVTGVLQEQAEQVLRTYVEAGGKIY